MSDADTEPHERIFLIGYRGTGKSTIGRLLADRLGWEWLDADVLLEERAGKSIRQIFDQEGEAGFREFESALLEELCGRKRCVTATGGGVILQPENRKRLRESGVCIWLQADAATIWRRINADQTTAARRPTLTVGGRAEVEQLLQVREPLYRACADFIVDTVGREPEAIAADIARMLADPAR